MNQDKMPFAEFYGEYPIFVSQEDGVWRKSAPFWDHDNIKVVVSGINVPLDESLLEY